MVKWLIGIAGAIGVIAAAASLFAGWTLYYGSEAWTDEQGFFNSGPGEFRIDGHALVTRAADIDLSTELPAHLGEIATLRVQARSLGDADEIFLGIADPHDIEVYLAGAEYALLESVTFDPWEVDYALHPGQTAPALPLRETFWEAAAYGTGRQSLTWELEGGVYALAVMNADASAGVHAELVLGGRVPLAQPTGVALLVGGSVLLSLGAILLAIAL
jgi:hypothetical protein